MNKKTWFFSVGSIVFITAWLLYVVSQIEPTHILGSITEVPNTISHTPTVVVTQITKPTSAHSPDEVFVTRIIDGDTIEIATEGAVKKVRYIGVDTPETVDPRKGVECYGREASQKNKDLVEGKYVRLERDISDTDSFGRLLRYVYVDDVMVNEVMVKEGYAYALTYPPDVTYSQLFRETQEHAKEVKNGLWGSCPL